MFRSLFSSIVSKSQSTSCSRLICIPVLNKSVPFFVRPITNFISGQVHELLLDPGFTTELSFIEQQLQSSGGDHICGKDLAAADFMLAFCLEVCMGDDVGRPLTKEKYPTCIAYLECLRNRAAWKRALERVEQAEKETENK